MSPEFPSQEKVIPMRAIPTPTIKKIFRATMLMLTTALICLIYAFSHPGQLAYWSENKPDRKVVIGWLNKRDPHVFNRCKVFLSERDPYYSIRWTDNHTEITVLICGNLSTFWINGRTKVVDCYISYCGKNIGNKYCGEDIADRVCEQ